MPTLPENISAGDSGHILHHETLHIALDDIIDEGFDPVGGLKGTLAARPAAAAALENFIYWATDTSEFFFCDGVAWQEVSDIGAHVAAGDPHTVYQLESEKSQANGYASLDGAGLVPTAELATGAASAATFHRGDGTWAAPTTDVEPLIHMNVGA